MISIPKERLLHVCKNIDKTGLGMAIQMIDILLAKGLDTSRLLFQSYDFASSVSGQFNGVQKNVSKIVGHHVPYIPCQDHRTNTAVEHSCNSSLLDKDFFDALEGLYVFFSSSTKHKTC